MSAVQRAQGGDAVGSGFTLLFEAFMLTLAEAMPIANAARLLGEYDTRLWRIVEHYVWRAVEKLDLSEVRRIAADETSARRGHYISLFVDMARRKVVYVADGKDAATVKEFADFLEAHGGRREAVTDASIDMGAPSRLGSKRTFPTPRSPSTNSLSSSSPTRRSTKCGASRRRTTSRLRAGATWPSRRASSDRSPPACPMASRRRSTATSRPPRAGQGLPNQTKPQSHRLPDRRRRAR
jgi:Transposase/Helix-turn-helix domain of transposase family ISL3